MEKELLPDLSYNNRDALVGVLKSAFGAIPFAGPTFQEIIGYLIPQQRLDRVVLFTELLAEKLNDISIEINELKERMNEPKHSVLFSEACRSAADSRSDERIEKLRNLVVNGVFFNDHSEVDFSSLLKILNEISDMEFVYLYSYSLMYKDIQSYYKYAAENGLQTLQPRKHGGMSQSELDKETMKESYYINLTKLGLLDGEAKKTGVSYHITSLGRLLMRAVEVN